MTLPIAFVLTREPTVLDLSALLEAMRQRHPERSWTAGSPGPNRPRSPFILCGKRIVVVMPVEAPLPADEDMWARAATAWPEAHQVVARHLAHVIVSLMGESEGKIEDARIVTAVVGGLIAITAEACAVVFCGRVARSAQTWLDLSARAFAPYPDYPFALWIDVTSFRVGPQSTGALTYGLTRFIGREVEFEVPGLSGPSLLQRIASLACYMLEHGEGINDGDTIEDEEAERMNVKHRVSFLNGAGVLRVGPDPTPLDP